MYFYIQIGLKGSQFLDWEKLIAISLKDQLKGALNLKKNFFMSSYLMYMLATTQDLQYLPHEPWTKNITIYNYCPSLHKDKALEDFRKVHDVFFGKLCFDMKSPSHYILSLES